MTPFTLTAHEVLDALAANPTETCLSELVGDRLDASYFTLHDTLGDLDCYALVVVEVADGVLLLPVTEARTGDGWEQFNLAAAYTVPYPEDWNAVRAAYHGAKATLVRRLEDAIDARPKAGALSGLAGSTRWPVGTLVRLDHFAGDDHDLNGRVGRLTHPFGGLMWPGVTYAAGLDFSDSDRGQMDRCNLTVVDWRHGRIVRLDTAQASDATSLTRRAD
jgi:hypothetical protein